MITVRDRVAGGAVDELAPLRDALLRAARSDAARVLADADAEAARRIAEAERTAARILAEARAQGEADAAAELTSARRRARRMARGTELAAQQDVHQELRDRVLAAVRDRLADPRWRAALAAATRAELGADAEVRALPDGGITGSAAGRRVTHTAESLTDRALDRLGGRVAELWSR